MHRRMATSGPVGGLSGMAKWDSSVFGLRPFDAPILRTNPMNQNVPGELPPQVQRRRAQKRERNDMVLGNGCLRGANATGLLTRRGSGAREAESPGPEITPGRNWGARAAFPGALAPSAGSFGRDVNPCNCWRKRKNPATSRCGVLALTGGSRWFAARDQAP